MVVSRVQLDVLCAAEGAEEHAGWIKVLKFEVVLQFSREDLALYVYHHNINQNDLRTDQLASFTQSLDKFARNRSKDQDFLTRIALGCSISEYKKQSI